MFLQLLLTSSGWQCSKLFLSLVVILCKWNIENLRVSVTAELDFHQYLPISLLLHFNEEYQKIYNDWIIVIGYHRHHKKFPKYALTRPWKQQKWMYWVFWFNKEYVMTYHSYFSWYCYRNWSNDLMLKNIYGCFRESYFYPQHLNFVAYNCL